MQGRIQGFEKGVVRVTVLNHCTMRHTSREATQIVFTRMCGLRFIQNVPIMA